MNLLDQKLIPSPLSNLGLPTAPEIATVQILHIELWYADGSVRELNITSPMTSFGEDIERQYIYMRMYLRKTAIDLGIVAYQASIATSIPEGFKIHTVWNKVDCTLIEPLKPGQFV